MKTSKKIIVTAALFIIVLLITSLIVMRNHLKTVLDKIKTESKYKSAPPDGIDEFDFSTYWIAKMKQRKESKTKEGDVPIPGKEMISIDITLPFKKGVTNQKQNSASIREGNRAFITRN
jgi:hypothetical protein